MNILHIILFTYLFLGLINLTITAIVVGLSKKSKIHKENIKKLYKENIKKSGFILPVFIFIIMVIYLIILWPHSVKSGLKKLKNEDKN